ncbi:hypothetical protein HPB47_012850 [Ixodes persulcatus]|uniref:Uncharacterized protein n=1 Tax=Ixodes persulcatus TaxID=34615 RepID=A0AC60NSB8_IXOPE|nr:hypothetical protein HPB47_012850 [Ixodes persulcatus]
MTGCSVPLCAASSAKGVRCFRFPQEKARRRKWESCVKRDRWKASHTSRICERSRSEESSPHRELLRLIVEVPPLQVLRQFLRRESQTRKTLARRTLRQTSFQKKMGTTTWTIQLIS